MRRTGKIALTLVMALLLVFTVACTPAVIEEEGVVTEEEVVTEGEEAITPTLAIEWGVIEIRVTDPPPADVKSAVVYLTNIEVHRVSGNESGWIPVIGAPSSFDLMDVIGVEKILGSANVTAGKFTQIRMDVTEVTGNTTDDVPYTAEVPGDKLRIVRPFNVGGGTTTILTLDFDGEKSLIRTGNDRFLFKPVVKLSIAYKEKEQEQEQEQEQGQETDELEFEGAIEEMPADAPWIGEWVIDGQAVIVDADTVIEGTPEIGLVVEVDVLVQPDDSLLAIKIEVQ